MAADVTTFIRILNGYDDQKQKARESVGGGGAGTSASTPITRDLLGGCSTNESKELDLDLQVPSGWEKRLDLKSGKVYIQRCNSLNSSSSVGKKTKSDDLNFPNQSKQPLNLLDDTSLKLRLSPSISSSSSSSLLSCYQSVCTLDKVKCALERAKIESNNKKRSNSSSSHSNSSSSVRELGMEEEEEVEKKNSFASSFAAGCPGCLLYVLIWKNNPQCPRCHTTVPLPHTDKRPRIDLNISI